MENCAIDGGMVILSLKATIKHTHPQTKHQWSDVVSLSCRRTTDAKLRPYQNSIKFKMTFLCMCIGNVIAQVSKTKKLDIGCWLNCWTVRVVFFRLPLPLNAFSSNRVHFTFKWIKMLSVGSWNNWYSFRMGVACTRDQTLIFHTHKTNANRVPKLTFKNWIMMGLVDDAKPSDTFILTKH